MSIPPTSIQPAWIPQSKTMLEQELSASGARDPLSPPTDAEVEAVARAIGLVVAGGEVQPVKNWAKAGRAAIEAFLKIRRGE